MHYSSPIWSCSHSQSRRDAPATFSVSAPLPTYARWSSALLPPTTRFAQGNFKLAVSYEVAVQLKRSGRLRRDERVSAEFAYAPRTIPDAGPSISSPCVSEATDVTAQEESKSLGDVRWKAADLKPSTTIIDPASVTVWQAPGSRNIPCNLPHVTSYRSTFRHLRATLRGHQSISGLSSRHRITSTCCRPQVY